MYSRRRLNDRGDGESVATVRVMYWKEVPVQVQAEDDDGQVSKPLHERFQQGVDAIAMFDGSAGTDDYLMAWEWQDYGDVDGTARDAAETVAARFNEGFPADFVSRIRDRQNAGERDATPGAVNHWIDEN